MEEYAKSYAKLPNTFLNEVVNKKPIEKRKSMFKNCRNNVQQNMIKNGFMNTNKHNMQWALQKRNKYMLE